MPLKSDVMEALKDFNETAQNEICSRGQSHCRENPLPDPGLYDAAFDDVDVFSTEAPEDSECPGASLLNVRLKFLVSSGPLQGRVLEKTFWGNSERDQGALFDFVTVLTGNKVATTKDAVLALGEANGVRAMLAVKTYKVKNGPNAGETRKVLNIRS